MTGVRSLLFPRSIAVVGASPRNLAAVETVVASGVTAWGVNPNRDEVAGLRCYPSVAELPEVPECAFLMVNHERVEAAFEEAAAAGVRAFVVPGVGAEAGAAAKPTTERLAARARELGAALLGPNCMGFFVPGGPAAWNGRPEERRRRVTSPCSASRDRSPTRSSPSAGVSGCAASSRRVPRR